MRNYPQKTRGRTDLFMPITFTAGYIEVWKAGERLSAHRAEREAVEAVLAHAENNRFGDYEIRHPIVKVRVTQKTTGTISGSVSV